MALLDEYENAVSSKLGLEAIDDPLSAEEIVIERERVYSRQGSDLAEAILYRGPTSYFWASVDALEKMVETRAIYQIILHGAVPASGETRSLKWSPYHRVHPWTFLVPYPPLADLIAVALDDELGAPRPDLITPIQETTPLNWLSRAYELGPEGEDEDIVFDMMSSVNEMLHASDFAKVDHLLAEIREQEIPLVVIEGLVRFCSRAQSYLPHWVDLKNRLIAEATRRGDAEEMLFTP